MPLPYEEIPFASADYTAACALRDHVLRQPIGLRLSDADTTGEATQLHFIARNDAGEVVATVLFKPLSATHIKLRQMAVAESQHGRGVGTALVAFAEMRVQEKGFRTIEANARQYAIGFYEKLGYATRGDLFEEVGLPTITMHKTLE